MKDNYVSLCGLSNWFLLCNMYVEYLREISPTVLEAPIDQGI